MKVKNKKRDTQLSKRFNREDIEKWQEFANSTTGGNLTLFMEKSIESYCEAISKSINPKPTKK